MAISSWNLEKNPPKIQHFWGEIGYSPSFRKWKVGLRASAGAVYLGCSRLLGQPVCRIPHCIAESLKIFSWKLFKSGSKWAPTNVHAICFRRKSCGSVQVKDSDVLCPTRWLEQCSVSILRCKPLIFRLHGWREHPKHISNCQVESPLDFHSHSAAFSFTTLNLCSLRRPRAAQS